MKRIAALISIVVLILSVASCQKQGVFYWGKYSDTYYAQTKSPSDETRVAHLKCIESIIEESKKKNLAVPPGVYAEYGYIMLKANNTDQAIALFEQEKSLYPESRVFMERLIAAARMRDADPAGGVATTDDKEGPAGASASDSEPSAPAAVVPATVN